jgi:glycosyltransferase involved in cell wall biosynthesis
VVDDGSTDGTLEWLKKQEGLVIAQQKHLGKCWAVNYGYKLAKGKYIRFLDSDDLLNKGAIDEQFQLAEANSSDLVVSGYRVIDQGNKTIKEQPWINCDDFIAQQLGECDGSHYSAFLFTKEILSDVPHRPDYSFRDDRMLVLEVAIKHPRIAVHTGLALVHLQHTNERLQFNGGLQKSVQNHQHLNIYKHIIDRLIRQNDFNKRRAAAATTVLWPLAHWMARDYLNDAVEIAKWIFELDPNFQVPEKGLLGTLYKKIGFKRTEQLLRLRRAFI